jgi:hypothetical protein
VPIRIPAAADTSGEAVLTIGRLETPALIDCQARKQPFAIGRSEPAAWIRRNIERKGMIKLEGLIFLGLQRSNYQQFFAS